MRNFQYCQKYHFVKLHPLRDEFIEEEDDFRWFFMFPSEEANLNVFFIESWKNSSIKAEQKVT